MADERPLGEEELRAFVRRALRHGWYQESFHARHAHPERNVTADDVIHGLNAEWAVAAEPEFSETFHEWKYIIRIVDIEGDELHIVIAVSLASQRLTVVSKW